MENWIQEKVDATDMETKIALNTGVALAADPPKAPAKTGAASAAEAANKKKAPKKNADAKKTPAPAPAAKK